MPIARFQGSAASPAALLVATLLAAHIAAPIASPRADAAETVAAIVQQVEVPAARALAVNDPLNLLVVGYTENEAAKLAVFRLDDAGHVRNADDPQTIELPRPDGLTDYAHYPLALTFHPTLPVLYVWQDITGIGDDDDDKRQIVYEQFHHLLIFDADESGLSEVGAYAASRELAFGQDEAALAVSGDGQRLFIPNFYGTHDHASWIGGIGYFDLDAEGRLVPVPVPIEGSLDGRGISEFDMQIKPTFVYTGFRRTYTDSSVRYNARLPIRSLTAPTRRAVLFGVNSGIGVWDTENRQQTFSEINLRSAWPRTDSYLAVHPDLPYLYALTAGDQVVLRMQHVEGFPTLLPQFVEVPGTEFRSTPVIVHGRHHALAVGSASNLALIGLDEDGRPHTEAHIVETDVAGRLRALGYSARHDRLYVAVDKLPEPDDG